MNKEQEKEILRNKLGRHLTVSEVGDIELKYLNKKEERSGKGGKSKIDKFILRY